MSFSTERYSRNWPVPCSSKHANFDLCKKKNCCISQDTAECLCQNIGVEKPMTQMYELSKVAKKCEIGPPYSEHPKQPISRGQNSGNITAIYSLLLLFRKLCSSRDLNMKWIWSPTAVKGGGGGLQMGPTYITCLTPFYFIFILFSFIFILFYFIFILFSFIFILFSFIFILFSFIFILFYFIFILLYFLLFLSSFILLCSLHIKC